MEVFSWLKRRMHRISFNKQACWSVSQFQPQWIQSKLSADQGDKISDPTQYWCLAGALQYLSFTRPYTSYAFHQICLYMHDPCVPHIQALQRIIRYLQSTKSFCIQLWKSSITDFVAYCDADWAGCPNTRRSFFGYWVYLGPNLISKILPIVSSLNIKEWLMLQQNLLGYATFYSSSYFPYPRPW